MPTGVADGVPELPRVRGLIALGVLAVFSLEGCAGGSTVHGEERHKADVDRESEGGCEKLLNAPCTVFPWIDAVCESTPKDTMLPPSLLPKCKRGERDQKAFVLTMNRGWFIHGFK